ncbi:MAG: transcriptional regulator, LysR family [Ramlibacter sp.]|jgi:DNA-binding transcriptional LysR family regulator|uniref:LysR family transcriptional regulator n=1 Tax=Ramlibacter sp. TaxID=1917967 RepID=UPI00260DB7A7|nr:LysR family transcriptional regulator [Ramlibacter sp.]MDB5750018.1 transcriptional regulator, LysR family [Ramlibacter sp.]
MKNLDLTTLQLFVTVCDTRSITKAAAQANIVGSAISKRIAQLEDSLGTPLLERWRHGVVPTAAGETLLEHARSMFASVAGIERDMAAYASGIRGKVRMLVSASALAGTLATEVSRFLQVPGHAGIQLDIEERSSTAVAIGVREGNASVGICWDAVEMHQLQARLYRMDRLAIVTPAVHPLAHLAEVSFEQALDFDHVGMPMTSAVKAVLQRASALEGKPLVYRVLVNSFEAALKVVGANLAVSVMPRQIAEPAAQALGVRVIPLSNPWAHRRIVVCYRDESSLSQPARLLVEHLASAGAQKEVAPGS